MTDPQRLLLNRRALLAASAAVPLIGSLGRVARAQAPATIRIGAPNSMTGGFGEGGRNVVAGLQVAAEQINARGGIKALGGARLEVVPADTTSDDPATAASVTRRLITQDKVAALVGAHTSTMTLSAQIEAERGEVPILTTSYSDQLVQRGYQYTFKVAPQASVLSQEGFDDIVALYQELKGKKVTRVAIFYGADAASQAIGKAYADISRKAGAQIVASSTFAGNLADPTSIVGPVLQSKPDVLFLNAYVNDTILITRALRSLGIMIPIIGSGSGISVKTLGSTLGKQADNLMGTLAWNWDLPTPGSKEFGALYHAKYPDEPFAPQEAGEGFAVGEIIAAALERAGSADPKKLRDSLMQTDAQTVLPGGSVSFEANGMRKGSTGILVSWIDGKLRTVFPKEDATISPPLP